nr:DEAD/DEAH box helicase family protein [Actinomycetota bacterium]
MIAERGVNTLVLVHRRELMEQWRERLSTFLEMTGEIGVIGGGKRKPSGSIDVAVMQSLVRRGQADAIVSEYGQVIVDECHHVSAFSFEAILRAVHARYVLGLTATPVRKDGHHPIITMQCGSIRFKTSPKKQAAARPFEHVVKPRTTSFGVSALAADGIQEVYRLLAEDGDRNAQIVEDVVQAARAGRSSLVLTERT